MEGIGSSKGTGELGAEYRLFMLILTGGVSVPFLEDFKNDGVDIRRFVGRAVGRCNDFGDSTTFRFLDEFFGVYSRLADHRLLDSAPLEPFLTGGLSPVPSESGLFRLLGCLF
jgi:hypothetical protein